MLLKRAMKSRKLADAREQHSFAVRRKPESILSNSCLNLPIAAEAEKRAQGEGTFGTTRPAQEKITTALARFLPLRVQKAEKNESGKRRKIRRNFRKTREKRAGRKEKSNLFSFVI